MVKSSSQNGSIHIVVVIGVMIALVSSLGFVFWNNILRPNSQSVQIDIEPYTRSDRWLTYRDSEFPIVFDHPPDFQFTKYFGKSEVNESVGITGQGKDATEIKVSYRKGPEEPNMIADGRPICLHETSDICLNISNDIASSSTYIGGEDFFWTSYHDKKEKITVRSKGLDQDTFVKIVESIRRP